MDPTVDEIARRSLLKWAGLTLVAGSGLAACGGNDENDGGGGNGPTGGAPSYQDIKDKLAEAAGTHHGTFSLSLMDCEVTNPDYLEQMKVHAEEFVCGNTPLPVAIEPDSQRDCGGLWANDLLLSGVLTRESAAEVSEFVRQQMGDDSIEDGMVAFGYHRFLDTAASREHGSPLFGNRTELTLFPGMKVWLPEEQPEGATETPVEIKDQLGNLLVPSTIYVLSGNGVRTISAADAGAEQPALDGTRMELPRAMLDQVVGLDENGQEQFASVDNVERLDDDSPDPEAFGWARGDVYYSTFDGGDQFSAQAPPASSLAGESSQITGAPSVPPQQSNAYGNGSISQTGQGLVGTPTAASLDPAPAITWGPPALMPRNHIPFGILYGSVGDAPTQDACSNSVDTAQAVAATIVGGYLVGCGKSVLAVIAACGPFFWLCGIGGMAICAATAAGLAILANAAANQARQACRIPNTVIN